MKLLLCSSFVLAVASITFRVQAASIGDPSPPLTIERWIKGSPEVLSRRTNLLVVDFWATWCGPCKQSIPHLTELQKKYAGKGVVIVGVSDEPVATVAQFVASQGDSMGYYVATDPSRRSFRAWMTAYGESGIPHAFIVDTKGTVVWHDFPNSSLDRALERLLAGTYDLELARNFEAGDRAVQHYTKLVLRSNAASNAAPVGEKILTDFSKDWRVPYRLSKAIMTDPAVRSRDIALALRAATKANELYSRGYQPMEMRARALYALGQRQEAVEMLKKSIAACTDPADLSDLQKLLPVFEKGALQPGTTPK